MNSLVIEIGGKKILMNEVFADGKALILKRDGLGEDYLAFANQIEISKLDLKGYLEGIVEGKLNPSKINRSNQIKRISEFELQKRRETLNNMIYFLLSIVVLLFIIFYLSNN